jgi:hypothetical protein
MIVLPKDQILKRNKILIPGKKYICQYIDKRVYYDSYYLKINGISGIYNIEDFLKEDGTEIKPGKYIINDEEDIYKNEDKLKKGASLLCITKNLKTLTYGKIYTIDNFYSKYHVYLKEIKKNISYSISNFRFLSEAEIRELEIGDLIGDDNTLKNKTSNYHKFDTISEEELITMLIKAVIKSFDYIEKTGVKDTSVLNVLEHKYFNKKNNIKKEHLNMLKKIDWEDFINKKRNI